MHRTEMGLTRLRSAHFHDHESLTRGSVVGAGRICKRSPDPLSILVQWSDDHGCATGLVWPRVGAREPPACRRLQVLVVGVWVVVLQ